MKYIAAALAFATAVAGHGYVNNATIGGKEYIFYQPYQDQYMNPAPQRISRAIQGNGPVEDVTIADVQCGGYSAGGVVGSKPAALHAEVAAGSKVDLFWTIWPDSHVGKSDSSSCLFVFPLFLFRSTRYKVSTLQSVLFYTY